MPRIGGRRERPLLPAPGTPLNATDPPGGFTDDHIARLCALVPALGAVIEARLRRRIARDLLDTYLGRQAGRRVLAGQIRRGRGERVRAVIMASDLRGSTALSDRLPADEMIGLLNAYFERVAAPVQACGGDVLKFLGDGVLAIFPVDELGEANAAAAALQAAAETLADLVALCRTLEHPDRPPLRAGIGLHLGDVFYGNVGAPSRLDFTVIGPAVNLAFRIEGMTKELRRPLLASRAFARAVCQRRWSPWAPIRSAASPSRRSCSALPHPARKRRPRSNLKTWHPQPTSEGETVAPDVLERRLKR